MNTSTPPSWLTSLRNARLGTKILLFGISGVLVTVLALVGVIIWQGNQYNALAQDEFNTLVDNDLGHITEGVYNMVVAQDELVQQLVNYSLNVARQEFYSKGAARLSAGTVSWQAVNQFTQDSTTVILPKLMVGDTWLGQNSDPSVKSPVVDDIQELVGGTATIFQRMNDQGDMLRVVTNVPSADGRRAIGTFIPAVMPDGSPNPVIATVLLGETYRGNAYVVNAWYDTAYEPILNEAGQVMGMLYVGVRQQNVESLRQAILRTKVGETGYVFVLGSDGTDQGRYIISQNGERDGENVWESQDAEGNYVIQTIINKALPLQSGETTTVRYLWQNPGEQTARWKVARIAYYQPWHWVIGASTYEDELDQYRDILQQGQTRMTLISSIIGLVIAVLFSILAILVARTITNPVIHLVDVAEKISAGDLNVTAQVEQEDEVGDLATAFNEMTAKLRNSVEDMRRRALQVTTVNDISRRLSVATDTHRLTVDVVEQLSSALNYYHAHIYIMDPASQNLVMAGGTGEAGAALLARGHSIPKGKGLVGRAAETNSPVLEPDVTLADGWLPNPLLPDTKSEVAVPITSGGEVLGVLDVQQNVVNGLGQEDVALLQGIASQVAISYLNARRFEESRTKADLETTVNTIGQKIQRTASMEEALQTAVREIGLALGAPRVQVTIGRDQEKEKTGQN